jgi:hypothetical protein
MFLEKPRLYTLRFETPKDRGAGIAIWHNDTLLGGDTWFYFRSTVTQDDDDIEVDFRTYRHAEGTDSVFFEDENRVFLKGKKNTDGFTLTDPTGHFKVVALLVPE